MGAAEDVQALANQVADGAQGVLNAAVDLGQEGAVEALKALAVANNAIGAAIAKLSEHVGN